MDDYKTVLTPFETATEIKKSRFLNMVFHVESEDDVEKILTGIRKEHYKSTHVCWAYILNTVPRRQKSSDDGEPSGTAGKPILEVIDHRELKDVLVVVVRYFGGIRLGTGGLVRAYGGGTSDVLNGATVIKRQFSDQLDIVLSYSSYGPFSNALQERGMLPVDENFGENVTLSFQLPVDDTEEFLIWVEDQTSGTAKVMMCEKAFVDVPLSSKL